jgi:hypothetical protein
VTLIPSKFRNLRDGAAPPRSSFALPDDAGQMSQKVTTTLTLELVEVARKRIPRKGKRLGPMLVFSDNIVEINGDNSL